MCFQEDDDDKAPPSWLAEIESFTPGRAYKLGLSWLFISPKQWIFTLTAVAVIYSFNLSPPASLANYLVFILIVLIPFWLLILAYILFRERSEALLNRLFLWLKANAQMVLIVVLVGFGLYFLIQGITGLLA